MTTTSDLQLQRALTLLRAAEGEALHAARAVLAEIDGALTELDAVLSKNTLASINKFGNKLEKELGENITQVLARDLLDIQRETIARELTWQQRMLERVANGDYTMPPRVDVPRQSTWAAFDQRTPLYMSNRGRVSFGTKPLTTKAGKYYLPKDRSYRMSQDAALRNEYKEWLTSRYGIRAREALLPRATGNPVDHERLREFMDERYPTWNAVYVGNADNATTGAVTRKPGIARSEHDGPTVLAVESVAAGADRLKYQGKTFAQHFQKRYGRVGRDVHRALRTGFNAGKNIQQLTSDVRSIVKRVDHDTRTLVRSYFMHNATQAKETIYSANPALVESIIWVSTLDSRTTPLICGVRDGLEYTTDYEPINHGELWDAGPGRIHWNCRSTSVPKVVGAKNTATPRPSIDAGKNYERGSNVNTRGRVVKPTKDKRDEGIFKVTQRTTRTRYEGWLREQSKTNIDYVSDVLGSAERAKDFRDGKVTLSQLSASSPVARTLRRTNI